MGKRICTSKKTQISTWNSYLNGTNHYKNTGAEFRVVVVDGRYFIERRWRTSAWELLDEVDQMVVKGKYSHKYGGYYG